MKARIAKKRLQALLGTTKPVASQAIQEWINSHFDNETLIYNKAGVDQACRFRDMFSQCIATSYEQFKNCADVVGEHRSKSVVLPVVRIRANGLTVVVRDNFHDVVLSVVGLNKPLLREAQELLQAVCSAGFDSKVSFSSVTMSIPIGPRGAPSTASASASARVRGLPGDRVHVVRDVISKEQP